MPQNESGIKCKPEMSNKELELLWQKKKKKKYREQYDGYPLRREA